MCVCLYALQFITKASHLASRAHFDELQIHLGQISHSTMHHYSNSISNTWLELNELLQWKRQHADKVQWQDINTTRFRHSKPVCVCVFDLQMRSLRKEKYTAAGDSVSVCKSSWERVWTREPVCVCVRQKREVKLGSVMVSQNTNLPSFHQRTFCLSSDQDNYNYLNKPTYGTSQQPSVRQI